MNKKTIVVGGGASGLFFGAAAPASCGSDILILEKTDKIGTKLLMAGSGHCNLTHAGSIKEFLLCYGKNGSRIRTCLYRHNNLECVRFMEHLGVPCSQREDGKVFPASMDGRDVLKALLKAAAENSVTIRKNAPVKAVRALPKGFEVTVDDVHADGHTGVHTDRHAGKCHTYICENLVIASGGASYPSTGSDGSLFDVLRRDLDVPVNTLRPSLTPVYVQNYPFGLLSGISFKNADLKIYKAGCERAHDASGDLLLTHKNFSGPVMLNNCRYIDTGDRIRINFIAPHTAATLSSHIKSVFNGSSKTLTSFMAEEYNLPRRFAAAVLEPLGLRDKKLSSLSGTQIKDVSEAFAAAEYSVSGLGSFREAMATKGGISLDSVNLSTMESRVYKGLYFIGEVLDIDGDTGGYNLQFAYSSARTALDSIYLPLA
ncbi:MAG: NAD(P)/FAD-dependent oxidoreductase [Anaerovoracaceae bacterium]